VRITMELARRYTCFPPLLQRSEGPSLGKKVRAPLVCASPFSVDADIVVDLLINHVYQRLPFRRRRRGVLRIGRSLLFTPRGPQAADSKLAATARSSPNAQHARNTKAATSFIRTPR